jgi:hypothetical protein
VLEEPLTHVVTTRRQRLSEETAVTKRRFHLDRIRGGL